MMQVFGRANTDGGRSLSLAGRVAGVSLLCLVLAGGDARAGEGEAEGEGARGQITVSGQGLVSVRPDVVRVQLGLRVKAVAIGEAMEQNRSGDRGEGHHHQSVLRPPGEAAEA